MASISSRAAPGGESGHTRSLVDLVDEILVRYIDWREDATAVADAYTRWREAPARESSWRFLAYMAALEREETAAHSYAAALRELQLAIPSAGRARPPGRVSRVNWRDG